MTRPLRILQVVPKYRDGVCGIGDYAALLCRHWQAQGVEAAILPLFVGADSVGSETLAQWVVDAEKLRAVPPFDWLLLQYEPYGYGRINTLAATIGQLRAMADKANSRLAVYFHEVHDDGPIWRRRFWRGKVQREASEKLANAAHLAVTSNQTFHAVLEPWCRPNACLAPLPVPSTVGEPTEIAPWTSRHEAAVALGGTAKRAALYADAAALSAWCKSRGIAKIVDIGPPLTLDAKRFGVELQVCGIASPDTIIAALSQARYGLMHLGGRWLAKSSIFAAYCASGVVPVVFGLGTCGFDGLSGSSQMADGQSAASFDGESIVESALRWYRGHNAAAHAAILLKAMRAIR